MELFAGVPEWLVWCAAGGAGVIALAISPSSSKPRSTSTRADRRPCTRPQRRVRALPTSTGRHDQWHSPSRMPSASPRPAKAPSAKQKQLESFSQGPENLLTTNQGVVIPDNHNSLKAGVRGPTLLEDFILREKITHFDHERIPERVVHARGAGAHGYFELTKSLVEYTGPTSCRRSGTRTPVFVRFSTVAGSRGSADTVRDVRGFAVKFYTREGNYDLVGNNMPVFFIQDAMKFPDLVHALKPEPHHEMPQASSAHDTFWDFVSLMPETTHMLMWVMSDRAHSAQLPDDGRLRRPHLPPGQRARAFRTSSSSTGSPSWASTRWSGTRRRRSPARTRTFTAATCGKSIEQGNFPEWELGLQLIPEDKAASLGFDLLDPTKLIPEEMVPVLTVGRLVLNRNPDNFFAETEQVAFHPGHVVPGIDFSNDPLLQGRLFSYTDTQLSRLGGPNFHELPINRGVCPFHNFQRDGMHRMLVNKGQVSLRAELAGQRRRVPRRRRAAGLPELRRSDRAAQGPPPQPELRRPLQPGHAVLEQPEPGGEGAHHRGVPVRAVEGRGAGDPPARRGQPGACGRQARPQGGRAAGHRDARRQGRGRARRLSRQPRQAADRDLAGAEHGRRAATASPPARWPCWWPTGVEIGALQGHPAGAAGRGRHQPHRRRPPGLRRDLVGPATRR